MIIGLSGYARSGKDTVAELLCLNYGFKRISFAQPMRDALCILNPYLSDGLRVSHLVNDYGWEVAKQNPEVRRLLQVFGTEIGRKMFGEDVWINIALSDLRHDERIVISDVRFPNEADAIKEQGGMVWRINRHDFSAVNDHTSEHAMDTYMFDHAIYNDSTVDELANEVFMSARKFHIE